MSKVAVGSVAILVEDHYQELLLMSQRLKKGSGEGFWQIPGGTINYGERWQDAAMRELKEETGLTCLGVEFLTIANDIRLYENSHNLLIFCRAVGGDGREPQHLEPEKNTPWKYWWYTELPDPIFPPLLRYLKEIVPSLKDRV